jgi:hypothetical protein
MKERLQNEMQGMLSLGDYFKRNHYATALVLLKSWGQYYFQAITDADAHIRWEALKFRRKVSAISRSVFPELRQKYWAEISPTLAEKGIKVSLTGWRKNKLLFESHTFSDAKVVSICHVQIMQTLIDLRFKKATYRYGSWFKYTAIPVHSRPDKAMMVS